MTYIPKAQWGGLPAKRTTAWVRGQPTSWTLHWEGVPVPIDRSRAYYDARVRGIQRSHFASDEGYWDIAYNFIVSPIGDIYEGRGWGNQSGAQKSGNSKSIAIMYLGGPGTLFTYKAQNAFKWLIDQKPMKVYPHNFWTGTLCPGAYIEAWIDKGQPEGKRCYCPPKPAPSAPVSTTTIRQGSPTADVRRLQQWLKDLGYRLAVDGIWGPVTNNTLRTFQTKAGIKSDGIAGPITLANIYGALVSRSKPTPKPIVDAQSLTAFVNAIKASVLRRGSENTIAVRVLQRNLKVADDGVFGPVTERAVKAFQGSHNLRVDGIVGPNTWRALLP